MGLGSSALATRGLGASMVGGIPHPGFLDARIGDTVTGVCSIHGTQTGFITSGQSGVMVENFATATVGDTVTAACGDTGIISTGSSKVKVSGRAKARIGDGFTGIFTGIISSSAVKTKIG